MGQIIDQQKAEQARTGRSRILDGLNDTSEDVLIRRPAELSVNLSPW